MQILLLIWSNPSDSEIVVQFFFQQSNKLIYIFCWFLHDFSGSDGMDGYILDMCTGKLQLVWDIQ
jgi:hypothetical protein